MIATMALCLTQVIYFEARGEPVMGQYLVGAVVLNRVKSHRYPNDVCKVVHQRKQFSFTTRSSLNMRDTSSKQVARSIAEDLLDHYQPNDELLWYLNPEKAHPQWTRHLYKVMKIGHHLFFRRRKQ